MLLERSGLLPAQQPAAEFEEKILEGQTIGGASEAKPASAPSAMRRATGECNSGGALASRLERMRGREAKLAGVIHEDNYMARVEERRQLPPLPVVMEKPTALEEAPPAGALPPTTDLFEPSTQAFRAAELLHRLFRGFD